MYYVKSWKNDEVLSSHKELTTAKKAAKKAGHTGEDHDFLTSYPPVAYVANDDGLVYNPRFKKA